MKASLLARVAPALLLSSALAGGIALPGFAQSTSPGTAAPAVTSATPSGSPSMTAPATPSNSATTSTTRRATTAKSSQPATAGRAARAPIDQRIADLHSKLHITQQQEPQWQQFAQVMRDNATQIDAAYQQRADKLPTMTAVDSMQTYAQIEQTRAQDMQKLVPAFQSLYASLSDQQKKEADQLFRARAESAQQRRQAASR